MVDGLHSLMRMDGMRAPTWTDALYCIGDLTSAHGAEVPILLLVYRHAQTCRTRCNTRHSISSKGLRRLMHEISFSSN